MRRSWGLVLALMVLGKSVNLWEFSFLCSKMGIKHLPPGCDMQIKWYMSMHTVEPKVQTFSAPHGTAEEGGSLQLQTDLGTASLWANSVPT